MASDGFAIIKTEYVLSERNKPRELNLDFVAKNDVPTGELVEGDSPQPPRKKLKGQNKKRPRDAKIDKASKLCLKSLTEKGCPYKETCCFSHDLDNFAKNRPADISSECFLYRSYGYCPYNLLCRFGSDHLIDGKINKIDNEKWTRYKETIFTENLLTKELQVKLRKRQYSFSDTDLILKKVQKALLKYRDTDINQSREDAATKMDAVEKEIGPALDEDLIKLRQKEKKKIDFCNKLYCAPLTTVGNLPFRRIVKELGADITCGEMSLCTNLLQGYSSEWALLKRHHTEDIYGVQVCGAFPDTMTRCSQLIKDNIEVDFVDINMGCPIDLVFQTGAGCGLMNRKTKFEEIVHGMTSILDVPLTVKMRTGIYSKKNTADSLIRRIKSWGDRVAMIALHGRSKEQRYTKAADWNYIAECVEAADPIPLFGCGDILTFEDANRFKESSKVAGIMIARGALIKPWIFTEIKEQRHWDISSQERFDIIKRYVNYGLEHWGSDTEGVERTRRFLLEWLSFLYRYIPVALLENPPQKINERPLPYKGRNELETLMASNCCADWVKLSEMFLGPVPENFAFLPKHKANAYQSQ